MLEVAGGGEVRAEEMDLQRFPTARAGGLVAACSPSSSCHTLLHSNSPELHAGPQGNQGGISINYLLNLDKY